MNCSKKCIVALIQALSLKSGKYKASLFKLISFRFKQNLSLLNFPLIDLDIDPETTHFACNHIKRDYGDFSSIVLIPFYSAIDRNAFSMIRILYKKYRHFREVWME
jgi:hypothetical protein